MRARARCLGFLLVAALMLGSTLSVTAPSAHIARAATTVEVCGTVTVHVKPTALLAGAITIGGTAWVIAAGTSVASDVQVGADLCLRLTVSASGSVTELVVVGADATSTLKVCGIVSAYAEAAATKTGSLTIAQTTLTVALNVDLPAKVQVGADICADFELNGFGHIRDGEVVANATSTLKVCGIVSAYVEATATKTGSLTIADRKLVVAIGADLPAAIKVGADLCATLELNAFGQVQDGNATANVTSTVQLCGVVDALTAATATKTGSLTIRGEKLVVAMGADLPAAFRGGADICATLELNAFGQVQDAQAVVNATSTLSVCGEVTSYSAASSSQNGQLTIGSTGKTIAAGTQVDSQVRVGAYIKLRLTLDAFGRISDVTVLRVGASLADACEGASTVPTPTPSPTPSVDPTPSPNATPTPDPNATPTATADPNATPTPEVAPGEVCPPTNGQGSAGDAAAGGPGNGGGSAPALPDTATAVERAGQVMASAAVPFALFALGMFVAALIGWWRRRTAAAMVLEAVAE